MIRLFFWSKWGLVRLVISFVISSLISLVFCTELYYKLWLSDLGPRHFSFSKYLVVQSQLCPALCDPMDCSTSGFPVLYHLGHEGSPRILQWIAYSFSKGTSSLPRNWTWVSCITDSLPAELPGKPPFTDFVIVQLLSPIQIFVTAWPATRQASLSFNLPELAQLLSIELVMTSNHLVLCHPLLLLPSVFAASESFPMSWLFASGGQSIGTSASASVPPMNIQDWFPLGSSDLISLQSKGLSRVFSSTTVQKHQFFGAQPSLWSSSHIHTWLLKNI